MSRDCCLLAVQLVVACVSLAGGCGSTSRTLDRQSLSHEHRFVSQSPSNRRSEGAEPFTSSSVRQSHQLRNTERWQAFIDADEAIRAAAGVPWSHPAKWGSAKAMTAAESERESRLRGLECLEEEGVLSSSELAALREYCRLSTGIGSAQVLVQFDGQVEIWRLEQLAAVLPNIDANEEAQLWVFRQLTRIARSDIENLRRKVAMRRDPSTLTRGLGLRGRAVIKPSSHRMPATTDISALAENVEELLAEDELDRLEEAAHGESADSTPAEPTTTLSAIQRDISLPGDMSRWRAVRRCGDLGRAADAESAVHLLLSVMEQEERWFIKHRASRSILQLLGRHDSTRLRKLLDDHAGSRQAVVRYYVHRILSESGVDAQAD